MLIIPTINCGDFACVAEKLKKAGEFFSGLPAEALTKEGWVQIDIADGKFTSHSTWNQPKDLEKLKIENLKLKINPEVHLMVENPLAVIDDWIKAGAKRIIIHIETLELKSLKIEKLKNYASDCEIGLAINPETPIEDLIPFLSATIDSSKSFMQILAVNPGLSGQKFQPQVLDKIKFLKKNFPDVIIEVDGGINLETARLCQEAGADILAVGSYIWESEKPQKAYEDLQIATNVGQIDTNRELLYKELSYKLQGVFYNVRNKYGMYHKEKIYHNALKEEFQNNQISYISEPRIDIFSVTSGKKLGSYVPDFIVDSIIIELKTSPFTIKDMEMQLIEYLKSSKYELAYLVNFGEKYFKPKRYIHTKDRKNIISD
ncbi:hypothetical protein COY96_02690 [Candidatus Wolfebacteria bacterium CG_4_10_14_0_8_um_filter_37_11]|uniref:Ribulose-phosphate 3-epimerase n=2 Tax=Candidatus Wolfeibacteriota TaxID=1752735 RepID=A0A2M7Q765_9BACT|nr:MAG: hypothetical protein COY96_02690 [Candidatus Wolfebacteria bacterium CG_4_10_14_0_8_um_filter_37_11]PJA41825.1 MAG: hypothetical protein CO177_00455 [Candidatus Wolfebacteria bacterium CG_4_9_14_3_um_filter_37_9]